MLFKNHLPSYTYEQSFNYGISLESLMVYLYNKYLNEATEYSYETLLSSLSTSDKVIWLSNGKTLTYKLIGSAQRLYISVAQGDVSIQLIYDRVSGAFTWQGVPEYLSDTITRLDTGTYELIETKESIEGLLDLIINKSSNLFAQLSHQKYRGKKFLPEALYTNPDKSLSAMVETVTTQIIDDLESFPMYDSSNLSMVRQEFKLDEVFESKQLVYNISSPQLLQGILSVKGVDVGLKIVLKIMGVEVTILRKPQIEAQGLVPPGRTLGSCDIILDLSFRNDLALGAYRLDDGTVYIDETFDDQFAALLDNVTSVCLNLLSILYRKSFIEDKITNSASMDHAFLNEQIENQDIGESFAEPQMVSEFVEKIEGFDGPYVVASPNVYAHGQYRAGQGRSIISPMISHGVEEPKCCMWDLIDYGNSELQYSKVESTFEVTDVNIDTIETSMVDSFQITPVYRADGSLIADGSVRAMPLKGFIADILNFYIEE